MSSSTPMIEKNSITTIRRYAPVASESNWPVAPNPSPLPYPKTSPPPPAHPHQHHGHPDPVFLSRKTSEYLFSSYIKKGWVCHDGEANSTLRQTRSFRFNGPVTHHSFIKISSVQKQKVYLCMNRGTMLRQARNVFICIYSYSFIYIPLGCLNRVKNRKRRFENKVKLYAKSRYTIQMEA